MASDLLARWTILVSVAIAASLAVALSDRDIGMKAAAMLAVVLTAAAVIRFDFAHPYVWFGGSFLLYSAAGPLLYWWGVHPYHLWGGWDVREMDFAAAMNLQFIGLVTALLTIGPQRVSFVPATQDPGLERICIGAPFMIVIAAAVGAAGASAIVGQGFVSKADYVLLGDWETRLSFGFNILATALGAYLAGVLMKGSPAKKAATIAAVLALGLLIILVIGQRHFLFRTVIIMLMAIHVFGRRLSVPALLPLALAGLLAGTILGGAKMLLVQGETEIGESLTDWTESYEMLAVLRPELEADPELVRDLKMLAVGVLGGEAMTAGNNLAMILSRAPEEFAEIGAATLINDIARAILPGFLIADTVDSTSAVYNRLIFPLVDAAGGGVGFSIIGYGYLYWGWTGAIAIMAAVGGLIGLLYRAAAHKAFNLLFYIGFVPVGMYIARNDISGPLSQGIKHVLLPLLLMVLLGALMRPQFSRHASQFRAR